MKELIEFDINKFVSELKKLNQSKGYSALKEGATEADLYRIMGWQDCMEAIIDLFEECLIEGK